MNVLFHRYGNICELDIIESFKRIGLNVIEESSEIEKKEISGEERIGALAKLILKNRPMFVFSINFFPYISEICERLNVLYLCWSVDCPVLEIYSRSIRNSVNRIFLFDYVQYSSVVCLNEKGIFYLPLASNTERWSSILHDRIEMPKYEYDVSFVGSLYKEKSFYNNIILKELDKGYFDGLISMQSVVPGLELLEGNVSYDKAKSLLDALEKQYPKLAEKYSITDADTDLAQYVVNNYILGFELSYMDRRKILSEIANENDVHVFTNSKPFVDGRIHFHDVVSTHKEMPIVFSSSKVNINITMRGIQSGIPQRVWDVLGCGGFLVTNYQNEIPNYFEIGRHLVCYESEDECKELVNYYLSHEEERRSIALDGYMRVKELNTYDYRVTSMLKMALA